MSDVAFNSDGKIDTANLTYGQMKQVLEATGLNSTDEMQEHLSDKGGMTLIGIDILAHFVYFSQRQINPEFTLGDAYNQPLSVLQQVTDTVKETANPLGIPKPENLTKNPTIEGVLNIEESA